MKWQDIKLPEPEPPKEEFPPEIDWLKEVETVKKECRAKTKPAKVIYTELTRLKIKNYTETYEN